MATVNFKPYGFRVLVEPFTSETTTAGGLIIPDTAQEKPVKGIIRAIGPSAFLKDSLSTTQVDPVFIDMLHRSRIDSKVYYGKYSGTEITIDGKDYLVMRDDDILGCFEDDKTHSLSHHPREHEDAQ